MWTRDHGRIGRVLRDDRPPQSSTDRRPTNPSLIKRVGRRANLVPRMLLGGALTMSLGACGIRLDAGSATSASTTTPVSSPERSSDSISTTSRSAAPTTTTAPGTAAPVDTTADAADPAPIVPVGFGSQGAVMTKADGTECELCLWTAETDRQHQQGLMGVTSLGDRDGMAFVFDAPRAGSFWMMNTVIPLTIAFLRDGQIQEVRDMVPCTTEQCPLTTPEARYDLAVEFTPERADELGVATARGLRMTGRPCVRADTD